MTTPRSGFPTGIVTFTMPGGPTLSARLDANGRASVTTSTLPAGTYTVTASYSGDQKFASSRSKPRTQVVNKAATTTTLTARPRQSVLHQPAIAGSAPVAPPITAPAAPPPKPSDKIATTTTLTLRPNPSVFGQPVTLTATVRIKKVETATTLVTQPNPSVVGQMVALHSAVTASPRTGVPTGTVTFTITGGPTLTGTLNNDGRTVVYTNALTQGSHIVTATYNGDNRFATSSSNPLTQVVNPASIIHATLTASPATIRLGAQGFFIPTLSATLTETTTHTGIGNQTIIFTANPATGPVTLGTAVTTANGTATLANVRVSSTLVTTDRYIATLHGAQGITPATTSAPLYFRPAPFG